MDTGEVFAIVMVVVIDVYYLCQFICKQNRRDVAPFKKIIQHFLFCFQGNCRTQVNTWLDSCAIASIKKTGDCCGTWLRMLK